ncbi:MAG TPA: Ig-like domain-containing protein [Longimicrobiales bacterium]|nr:Ig-like domain-containing protein [Longimicrobiales bacterium]
MRSSIAALFLLLLAACSDSPTEVPDSSVSIVEVGPDDLTLTVGDTMLLTAYPKAANGQVLGGVAVQWTSANQAIAQVTPRGHTSLIRAQAPGNVEIRAAAEGKEGKVTVTIVAAAPVVAAVEITGGVDSAAIGDQARFDAVVRGANGEPITGRIVAWQVSDPARITLAGPGDGSYVVVTTHNAGPVTLTASVDGKQAQRVLIVKPNPPTPVSSIVLDPPIGVITLFTEETRQLVARTYAADGSELLGRAITWSSADNSIATVSATGLVTARGVGNANVTAEVEGQSITVSIDVRSRVAQVIMDPASLVLPAGYYAQISVTLRAEGGAVLQRPVTWSSSNAAVASVDDHGLVTAHAPGTAVIKANAEGQEASTDVRVVEWVQNQLLMVGDSALPATLYTRTTNGNTSSLVVREGQLRMALTGMNSGRYEIRFWGTAQGENQSPVFGSWTWGGTFTYNINSGDFTLIGYNGTVLNARRQPDGQVIVSGQLEADLAQLTLTYAAQD